MTGHDRAAHTCNGIKALSVIWTRGIWWVQRGQENGLQRRSCIFHWAVYSIKVCQNLAILTKFGSHHIGPLKIIFHKYMYSYVKTDPVRCWKRNVFWRKSLEKLLSLFWIVHKDNIEWLWRKAGEKKLNSWKPFWWWKEHRACIVSGSSFNCSL